MASSRCATGAGVVPSPMIPSSGFSGCDAENENGLDGGRVEAVLQGAYLVAGDLRTLALGSDQRCASDGHCSRLHAFSLTRGLSAFHTDRLI